MSEFSNWYFSLDANLQIFWGCAIVGSAVFALQAVLTIIGLDSADIDMGADFDGDTMDTGGGLSLFSIRSLVNFFVGFGWAGIGFYKSIHSEFVVYLIAIAVGVAFGYMYIYLRRKLKKLEYNGAVDINDALGKEADVYLRIPAEAKGAGKVQISLGGSIFEYPAITNGEEIASGKRIKVVEVIDSKTLLVEEL